MQRSIATLIKQLQAAVAGWRTGLVTGGTSDTLPSPSPSVRLLIYGQSQKLEKYPGVVFLVGGSAVHMCRDLSRPHGTPFISHHCHVDNILLYMIHTSHWAYAYTLTRGGTRWWSASYKQGYINTQPAFRWHQVSGILFFCNPFVSLWFADVKQEVIEECIKPGFLPAQTAV